MASPPGEVPIGIQKVRAVPLRVLVAQLVPRVTEPPVLIQFLLLVNEARFPTKPGRDATTRSVWKRVSVPTRCRNGLRESEGRSVRVRESRSASRTPLGNRPC